MQPSVHLALGVSALTPWEVKDALFLFGNVTLAPQCSSAPHSSRGQAQEKEWSCPEPESKVEIPQLTSRLHRAAIKRRALPSLLRAEVSEAWHSTGAPNLPFPFLEGRGGKPTFPSQEKLNSGAHSSIPCETH